MWKVWRRAVCRPPRILDCVCMTYMQLLAHIHAAVMPGKKSQWGNKMTKAQSYSEGLARVTSSLHIINQEPGESKFRTSSWIIQFANSFLQFVVPFVLPVPLVFVFVCFFSSRIDGCTIFQPPEQSGTSDSTLIYQSALHPLYSSRCPVQPPRALPLFLMRPVLGYMSWAIRCYELRDHGLVWLQVCYKLRLTPLAVEK